MGFRTAALCAVSLSALSAMPAQAQEEATPPPAEDVIVVTAQLRAQDPIDVPIALTAFNGEQLDRLGIQELEEFAAFVPGLEVQNQSPNNPAISIRGITSDSGEAFTEPRISVFQDGVSIAKSRGSYVELFDLERIEVAKGPQSTLYGRGALIGAINLIQNKANPGRAEGLVRASYGNYDAWMLEGMANLPLSDSAAIRIAGRVKQRDGYVDNLLGGEDFASDDTWAVRGSARVLAGESVTIDVIGNYQKDKPSGTAFKSLQFNPTDPTTGAVLGDTGIDSGATLAPGTGFEGGAELGIDREVWGITGLVGAELNDSLTLNSITAYREFHALEIFDADGISIPVLTAAEDADGEQTSQELRLTFDDGGMITAFVGASYFHEKVSQRTPSQFDERSLLARFANVLNGGGAIPGRPASDPAPLAVLNSPQLMSGILQTGFGLPAVLADGSPLIPGSGIANRLKTVHQETLTNASRTEAFDVFGDVTLKVSEQFEIGAGLRYTHDDKTSRVSGMLQNGPSVLGALIASQSMTGLQQQCFLTALAGLPTPAPCGTVVIPPIGLGLQPTAGNGNTESADLSDSGFTWRLTARYMPGEDSSIYFTYARGRRPEVLSALTPSQPFGPARFDEVPSETVDSFEIGGKTSLLDRTLYLDGALFYYRYDNFQTIVQDGTLLVTTNAGEAESYGFEGQARYRPSPNLQFFGSYAFNHSRFRTGIREGNRFRLSPDHTFALGGTFSADLGPGRVDFTPTLTYQSKVFFDDDNDRADLQQVPAKLVADNILDEFQGSYALVNARLGYTFDDPDIRVEAFVNNLFDKEYIKDAGNVGDLIGLATFIPGEPRFYGLQASFRF